MWLNTRIGSRCAVPDNPAVTAFLARWKRSINTYSQEQFAEELRELVDAQGRDGPTFSVATSAMLDRLAREKSGDEHPGGCG